MNSNRGIDPMLSSLTSGGMWNTKIIEPITSMSHFYQLNVPVDHMSSPVPDILFSPDPNPAYSDMEFLWGNERKRVISIQVEEDDHFSSSPCSLEGMESSEMDIEDCDIKSEMNISLMDGDGDGHDLDNDTNSLPNSTESILSDDSESIISSPGTPRSFNMSEVSARKLVDALFTKIAFVPNPASSHREKIRYILSLSDCKEYSVENIAALDKRSHESARICAKIVQDIPQRYRWECVQPEEIPYCYTIVADCKKTSTRDKAPRPMNAFMIWAQGARRLINELCPKMQNAAISEALGYCWRQKSDTFKKRFEMEKMKLRQFHNVEFPQYKYKPKTKIQKAKEKQELSLSKCKVSKTTAAAVKREKLSASEIISENTAGSRRKSKYGRPRKIKQVYEPDQTVTSRSITLDFTTLKNPKSEESLKSSPTKPAIKDMLTLKILNDRRSREMTVARHNDSIQTCLGQLSPLEEETSSTSGDIFDELRDYENHMVRRDFSGIDGSFESSRFHTSSSSVYDTPASTPPLDENDLPHSPPQVLQTSMSSLPNHGSSITTISRPSLQFHQRHQQHHHHHHHQQLQQNQQMQLCQQKQHQQQSQQQHYKSANLPATTVYTRVGCSTTVSTTCSPSQQLAPKETMPSLKAILSSTKPNARQTSQLRGELPVHARAAVSHMSSPLVVVGGANNYCSNIPAQKDDSGITTDFLLNCVSDILNSPIFNNNATNDRDNNKVINTNNKKLTFDKSDNNYNNNSNKKHTVCDVNNNSGSFITKVICPISEAPAITKVEPLRPKSHRSPSTDSTMLYPYTILDCTDLDTLSLDMSVPLLSDDIMNSLLDTL